MAHAHFTARWVAAVPAPPQGQVDYFDQTPPSLGLRVAPSGRKTWFVMYRASGRLRRYTLGTYPAVSLADARQRATDARHSVAHGGDPAQARQDGRQAPTVAELGAQYLDLYAKVQKKSWREDARYLATEVLPAWGQRKAADVRRRDVVALLDQIAARGAPIAANRVLALVRKLWNWAISHDYLEHNPCLQVQPPGKEHSRERVLSAEEIRLVWAACTALPPVWEVYMKVVFLTAQRCGEVRTMQWTDVDLGAAWWTIPGAQAKNGLTHRVPLTAPCWHSCTSSGGGPPHALGLPQFSVAAEADHEYLEDGAPGGRQGRCALRDARPPPHGRQPYDVDGDFPPRGGEDPESRRARGHESL